MSNSLGGLKRRYRRYHARRVRVECVEFLGIDQDVVEARRWLVTHSIRNGVISRSQLPPLPLSLYLPYHQPLAEKSRCDIFWCDGFSMERGVIGVLGHYDSAELNASAMIGRILFFQVCLLSFYLFSSHNVRY